MTIKEIITVAPRGFCAGVTRSIDAVKECVKIFGAPIYTKHAIVHNKTVISDLEKLGVVTVETVDEIPRGSIAVFSAHGSPPEHFEQARERDIKVIDATCPLVTKVHIEIVRYANEGKNIVYVGHKKHVEGIGVVGEAKKRGVFVPIIDTVEDVEKELEYNQNEELVILTQTTLSINEARKIINAIKKKYKNAIEPPAKDICYATTNRQEAIKELAKEVDIIIVVGSKTSSNSNKLVEVAKDNGVDAYLVDSVEEIQNEWLDEKAKLGLSAGASAPEYKVQEIINHFKKSFGVNHKKLQVQGEKMKFTEPAELIKARKKLNE